MLDEGHVFTGSRYQHLNTETSPGHAALSTGAPPRVTGVVGNRWFVRAPDGTAKVVSSIEQPGPPAVPGQPPLFYREVEKAAACTSSRTHASSSCGAAPASWAGPRP